MSTRGEKIKELLSNEVFLDQASQADSIEGLICLFNENGVEISESEIKGLLAAISSSVEDGELSEDALEEVSGGVWSAITKIVAAIKTGYSWGKKLAEWEASLY